MCWRNSINQFNNKRMKKLLKSILEGALLLVLPLCLTSCEGTLDDIFGEWDKPTPQVPASVVEDARVLGAAEAKGAIVTVTYTVGSTTYTAKFEKGDGDNYTLISNTKGAAAARAMTRAAGDVPEGDASAVGDKVKLVLEGGKLKLIVKDANDAPLFEAHIGIEGGETAIINTNALNINCKIANIVVNDDKKEIKNPEMQEVTITFDYEITIGTEVCYAKFQYVVQYSDGEKWADVIARYKNCEHGEIGTNDDGIISISFKKDIATGVIKKAVSALSVTDDVIDNLATTVSQIKFYLYTKEEVYLSARALTRSSMTNKYTPVKSTEAVDGSKTYILSHLLGHALTSAAIGEIIGNDGKAYATNKNTLYSIGVTAVAMVAYMGSETGDATYNHGLALALKDESSDIINFSSAKTACESKTAVTDASWILASESQWNTMISAAGTYTDLRDGFESVGGTNMQSDFYWSSTEAPAGDDAGAKNYNFGGGDTRWRISRTDNANIARACLVF